MRSCLLCCATCTGVPRKPGMTRDDLFNINAGIVKNLVGACAKHCPEVRSTQHIHHSMRNCPRVLQTTRMCSVVASRHAPGGSAQQMQDVRSMC